MRHPLWTALVTVLLLAIGGNASALDPQTTTLVTDIALEVPGSDRKEAETAFVGISGCEQMLNNDALVSASFQTTVNPTNEENFDAAYFFEVDRDSKNSINCDSGDACSQVGSDDINRTDTTVEIEFPFEDLTELMGPEDCLGFDKEYFVRLRLKKQDLNSEEIVKADARVIVDTVRPAAPTGLSLTATENIIRVEFTPPEDTDIRRYAVYYSKDSFSGPPEEADVQRKFFGDDEADSGEVTVELERGATVHVAVVTQDETGNLSNFSDVRQTEVIETIDFWELYRKEGGAERGGCSTTGGANAGWLALLVLAGLFFLRRRRRRRAGTNAALAAAVVAASLAFFSAPTTASAETPIYGNLSMKIGGYYPAIDDEFGGSGPFRNIYGSGDLIYGELEVDGYLWDKFGRAGFGLHFGYTSVEGNALSTGDQEVPDTTSFTVLPMRLSGLYRYDYSAENHGIPLVPVVNAGLDYYYWSISDSDGETADFEGDKAQGGKWGWHVSFGLQLLLDVIDPATAAVFDLNWGVNNSYLFAEYFITQVDDFGGEGFDLSDDMFLFGLTFEF